MNYAKILEELGFVAKNFWNHSDPGTYVRINNTTAATDEHGGLWEKYGLHKLPYPFCEQWTLIQRDRPAGRSLFLHFFRHIDTEKPQAVFSAWGGTASGGHHYIFSGTFIPNSHKPFFIIFANALVSASL